VSAYRTAIDETTRTIDLRARYYRNLIVTVVSIAIVVLIGGFAARWSFLWGWLMLVPTCAVFFYLDCRVMNGWRQVLLSQWTRREIDCEVLRQTIRVKPGLPMGTAEGMLMTLPSAGDLRSEQELRSPTRQAIAAVVLAMHRARADALLLQTIASTIIVGALLVAIWTGSWKPLWALAATALVPVARGWTARSRHRRADAEVAACRLQPGFDEADFARVRASLS
jgi:hypothetical protein